MWIIDRLLLSQKHTMAGVSYMWSVLNAGLSIKYTNRDTQLRMHFQHRGFYYSHLFYIPANMSSDSQSKTAMTGVSYILTFKDRQSAKVRNALCSFR